MGPMHRPARAELTSAADTELSWMGAGMPGSQGVSGLPGSVSGDVPGMNRLLGALPFGQFLHNL